MARTLPSALTSRELTLLMRMVYAGADVIFANSVNTRRMLRELGIAADRIEIVYPGVDTAAVQARHRRNRDPAAYRPAR